MNNRLMPPLRLVLNTDCNGTCYFCHHEGLAEKSRGIMPKTVISECVDAASKLNITKICLTGGEPTLRDDLSDVICYIKGKLPYVELSLTTNGLNIEQITTSAWELLNKVNLSIVSFREDIYLNYQKVDPIPAFKLLKERSKKTTINLVVIADNKDEVTNIIDKSFSYDFNVDLMFELISNDIELQKEVLKKLTEHYGVLSVCYNSTPVMMLCELTGKQLRIKAPNITGIMRRNLCDNCPNYNSCPEKVCGLRVYPDGDVSPCLSRHIQSAKATIHERIEELYPLLGVPTNELYSFFIN